MKHLKSFNSRMHGIVRELAAPAGQRYIAFDPDVDIDGNRILVAKDADENAEQAVRRDWLRQRWGQEDQWQQGLIRGSIHQQGALPLIFVGLGLLLTSVGIGAGLIWGGEAWLFGGIFALVGIVFTIVAINLILKTRKFRPGELRLASSPIVLGQTFRATLQTGVSKGTRPESGFNVALRCVLRRETRDSDGHTHRSNKTIWSSEITSHGAVEHGADCFSINLRWDVPADQPPTSLGKGAERHLWTVYVSADLPGVDYSETFEIPVFTGAMGAMLENNKT